MNSGDTREPNQNPEIEQVVANIEHLRRNLVMQALTQQVVDGKVPFPFSASEWPKINVQFNSYEGIVVVQKTVPPQLGTENPVYFGINLEGNWTNHVGYIIGREITDPEVLYNYALAARDDFLHPYSQYDAELTAYEEGTNVKPGDERAIFDRTIRPYIEQNMISLLEGLRADLQQKLAEMRSD